MLKIQEQVISEFPRGVVSEVRFEAAKIVVYVKDKKTFYNAFEMGKNLAQKYKKRFEIRMDPKLLPSEEEIEEIIKNKIPDYVKLRNIFLEKHLSTVVLEVYHPEKLDSSIIEEIRKETLCAVRIKKAPLKSSKIIDTIRAYLHKHSKDRKVFLHEVGKKILAGGDTVRRDWIRVTILGAGREVGRSALLLQTPESMVLLDMGIGVSNNRGNDLFPYLNAPEFDIDKLDAVIITHSHLDHIGSLPFLYRMGWKGPVYLTEPTRDIGALMLLDYEKISVKQQKYQLFTSKDIQEMIKHSITLRYGEVTDITPDIKITLYNAGHIIGSAMVHLNIGNGKHNVLYTGDIKYSSSRLIDKPKTTFPRLETLIIESTYGGNNDYQPPREEVEKEFVHDVKETLKNGGKVLVPALAVGRAQEILLLLTDAILSGELPHVNIYLEGILWETSMIHTAYPEFLSQEVQTMILSDKNPFEQDFVIRVSAKERKDIMESKEPAIIIATSGMMNGGPIIDYFKYAAKDPKNLLAIVSYQARGTLGRRILEGEKEINIDGEIVKVNLKVKRYEGFSGHADRRELVKFVGKLNPRPKQAIIVHGEPPKPFELAYKLKKTYGIETYVPKNLDAIRLA